jgi:O-antigen/teichoic acid export membrane protein
VGPFIFGLIAVAPIAIEILSGTKFLDAIPAFQIIGLGMLLYSFSAFIKSVLTAIGKIRIILYVHLVTFIVKITITYSLTSFLGIVGTAIGSVITYGLMFLIYKIVSERELKIKIRIKEIIQISGISALMGGIVFVIAQISNYTFFLLPLYVFLGIIIYFIVLGLFNILTKADFLLLIAILPISEKPRQQILEKISNSKYLVKLREFFFNDE